MIGRGRAVQSSRRFLLSAFRGQDVGNCGVYSRYSSTTRLDVFEVVTLPVAGILSFRNIRSKYSRKKISPIQPINPDSAAAMAHQFVAV